jgi:hypothetical protein
MNLDAIRLIIETLEQLRRKEKPGMELFGRDSLQLSCGWNAALVPKQMLMRRMGNDIATTD